VFSGDVRRARVIPWLVRHSAATGSRSFAAKCLLSICLLTKTFFSQVAFVQQREKIVCSQLRLSFVVVSNVIVFQLILAFLGRRNRTQSILCRLRDVLQLLVDT